MKVAKLLVLLLN